MMRRASFAFFGALALAACGHDPVAPTISNLQISPAMARASETLAISVHFDDEDGDLAGGSAELSLWDQKAPEGQLFEVALTGKSKAESGTIDMTLRVPAEAEPGTYALSVTVIDSAERRSAPLVGEVEIVP